ncbi:MAG TPA: RNA polymerase sigma factor [Vicinamibacterales bacterium]|jgi:RNA polymerase sigma-70 factor (ECF subfamily)
MPTSKEADLALVARCRGGDLGAFEQLYKAHAGRLYSLAYRMVGNATDAEDLLQEIFLSAHRKLESFRGDAALGTWLYRLATNHVLDYVRSRAARMGQLTDALDETALAVGGTTHRLADSAVARIDLERALGELPDGCRAAFVLHDVEGLEHKEVAELLGIAEGTSKSQVHKARMRLRKLLSDTP